MFKINFIILLITINIEIKNSHFLIYILMCTIYILKLKFKFFFYNNKLRKERIIITELYVEFNIELNKNH